MTCDICDGSRVVRHRVRQKISASFTDAAISPIAMTAREYPCPACAKEVAPERIDVCASTVEYTDAYKGDEYERHLHEEAAHRLVGYLLSAGLFTFTKRPAKTEWFGATSEIIATLGVVSPRYVASLDERISARQDEVASDVVDVACAGIGVWDSHYTGNDGYIRKSQAMSEVRDALKAVLAKRSLLSGPSRAKPYPVRPQEGGSR